MKAEDFNSALRWMRNRIRNALPFIAPLALIFALMAIIVAGHDNVAIKPTELALRGFRATQNLSTEAAWNGIELQTATRYMATNRSEEPFYFSFQLPDESAALAIEIPSRHATLLQCWSSNSVDSIGSASRTSTTGRFSALKAGFVLDVVGLAGGSQIMCRGEFRGPARIEVKAWNKSALTGTASDYARSSGLLDGGGVMLALFLFAVAVFHREPLYAMLGTWLFGNLRIAAISAGMDFSWLGFPIPVDWLYPVRQWTYAVYYCLTIVVFALLFSDTFGSSLRRKAVSAMQWSMLPLVLAAALLPYQAFLPVLWASGVAVILTQFSLIATLSAAKRTSVTTFFGLALFLTLSGSICEAIAGATGWRELTAWINHVSGALASSFLAAIAVAAHIRRERYQRVAAQKEAIRALNKVKDTYRASPVGLFTIDESAQFIRFNPAFCVMLGYSTDLRDEPIQWAKHFSIAQYSELCAAPAGQAFEVELTGKNLQGEQRAFLLHAAPGENLIEGSIQDVTERRAAVDRLQFLADHDPLTELLNRRGIELALEMQLKDNSTTGLGAIAYMDLDRFKLVNDLYGHDVGDHALKAVTRKITEVLENLPVARVGGDEFVAVFKGSLNDARHSCERLLRLIANSIIRVDDRAMRIECSIGLCELEPGVNPHDVIATADRACRQAKAENRLIVYEKSTTAIREHEEEVRLIDRLSREQELDGLYLQMQPIMSLEAPFDSLNFEVLLRMKDIDNRPINTAKLIAAAERGGLMPKIDRWVLCQTLSWLEEHYPKLPQTKFVCVNLSGVSLNDERFVEDALQYLKNFPRAATMICLEVTEQVALQDLANTRRWIDQLRQYGTKVALDDFGAGYTSFSYLRDIPADALKIDGSFIKTINQHPANHSIVQAIITLAGNLGMRTIAEWVEDVPTLEALHGLGAHYIQGWAISPAVDPEKILEHKSAAEFISRPDVKEYVENMEPTDWARFKQQLFPLGARLK